jgi:hypothetical protein
MAIEAKGAARGQTFPFKVTNPSPYDPFSKKGDEDDSAYYVLRPGVEFWRPWIRVPNGPAFVWPLGIEGFTLSVDSTLGIHKYIGDNAVQVDVIHKGQENFAMSGNLPGDTGPENARKLRDVFYADTPRRGKILFIPGILPYAQRVVLANLRIDHGEDDRGEDLRYSLDVVRIGYDEDYKADPRLTDPDTQPQSGGSGSSGKKVAASPKKFAVTATVNTLRKIASAKNTNWNTLYTKNEALFVKLKIAYMRAPDYKIKLGTKINY